MNDILGLSFVVIFWFPMWIRAISIKPMPSSTKKALIVTMAMISTSVSIYGITRPRVNSTLSWVGQAALAAYLVAVIASAYFYWPYNKGEHVLAKNITSAKVQIRAPSKKKKNYVLLPSINGTDGNASVSFINATFEKVNKAIKRYPDPDFGAWLIEKIYNKERTFAESRGGLKKKLFCSSCGVELDHGIQTPRQIEYKLKYKDFDPFVLQIKIPTVICTQCGKLSGVDLDGSLNNHLNKAIIAAFKSENIEP